MFSVHDVLEAWQNDEISTSRAFSFTGAKTVQELYVLCQACDVKMTKILSPDEMTTGKDAEQGHEGLRAVFSAGELTEQEIKLMLSSKITAGKPFDLDDIPDLPKTRDN